MSLVMDMARKEFDDAYQAVCKCKGEYIKLSKECLHKAKMLKALETICEDKNLSEVLNLEHEVNFKVEDYKYLYLGMYDIRLE